MFFSGSFDWSVHYIGDTHICTQVSRSKFLKRYFLTFSFVWHCWQVQWFLHILLELLSKIGVTVSKSTYLRFQTSVTKRRMISKPLTLAKSFTIASVDNIDRSTTYASIRGGQDSRGFHGTSVQAVESLPISLMSGDSSRDLPSTSRGIGRVDTRQNVTSEEVTTYHYF